MSAYQVVRDDVRQQYQQAVQQTAGYDHDEGLARGASLPDITISGSQPAWLPEAWRKTLAVAALTGAAIGLVLMTSALRGVDRDGTDSMVAGFAGSFAIVALVVAYFTVAGFGKAEFSIGSGSASEE